MKIHSSALAAIPAPGAELDRLGDQIAELSAHLEAATARLLDLIREFDARGGWNTGFRSCADWLSWRVGLDLGAARERVRVARALGTLPLLAQALARGELSYAKARALTRVATPETEERLLNVGRGGTAAQVERIVRGWRRVDRLAEVRETERQHASRALHVYQDEDGTMVVRGRLTPEAGALLLRALDAAREQLYQKARRAGETERPEDPAAEPPTPAQQRADALELLAETALHHGLDPGAPGERYQVVVHVDASALADPDQPGQSVLEGGARVSAETSQRLACDASRVVMRHDPEGRVVEVGARTRTIPPALRRALHHRDRSCRFPGCGLPFGQGHHVRHWAHGGPTTLSNLALLCRRHHRAVHEEGYQIDRQPDGSFRFRRPDGRPLPEVPPPAAVPADPVQALRAQHEAKGLQLHPRTTCPRWLGEPLDVDWAIDVLHPLARGDAGRRHSQEERPPSPPTAPPIALAGWPPGHLG
jgi:5-methylcytosine-specific restriction endonuclease McrA